MTVALVLCKSWHRRSRRGNLRGFKGFHHYGGISKSKACPCGGVHIAVLDYAIPHL
jgi:hypothetical protein